MTKGILGKKLGMTQVFTPEGLVIPVTVILAGPCTVLQKRMLRMTDTKLFKSVLMTRKKVELSNLSWAMRKSWCNT